MSKIETVEKLTRAEIQRQIREYDVRDRELTEKLAGIYTASQKAGVSSAISVGITERDRAAHRRAKELLNGHGHILANIGARGGETEDQIFVERDAVRIIIAALRREETEAQAVESLRWVQAHGEDWSAIVRGWVLAAAKLQEFEERAADFLQSANSSGAPLPLCEFVGTGTQIDVPGANLEIVLAAAVKGRVVSAAELKGVRNGE